MKPSACAGSARGLFFSPGLTAILRARCCSQTAGLIPARPRRPRYQRRRGSLCEALTALLFAVADALSFAVYVAVKAQGQVSDSSDEDELAPDQRDRKAASKYAKKCTKEAPGPWRRALEEKLLGAEGGGSFQHVLAADIQSNQDLPFLTSAQIRACSKGSYSTPQVDRVAANNRAILARFGSVCVDAANEASADRVTLSHFACVNADKGCKCTSTYNGRAGNACCRTCARGQVCTENHHPRAVPVDYVGIDRSHLLVGVEAQDFLSNAAASRASVRRRPGTAGEC